MRVQKKWILWLRKDARLKKTLDGARVLLVEDETMIAMNIEALCKEHGAEDVVTITSFNALGPDVLETGRISTAILDIRISDNWTDEFARLLQSRRIPFIFATGYAANHQSSRPSTASRLSKSPTRTAILSKRSRRRSALRLPGPDSNPIKR